MPYYKVKGHGKDTGRPRARTYEAKDEVAVHAVAEADGTIIDSLEELPPEPPTEGQVAYAKDLGIDIPKGITRDELSSLISCAVDDDVPASKYLIKIAEEYGIETNNYSGEASIYECIFSELSQPGREHELVAWFAFNVANDRARDRHLEEFCSPKDSKFSTIADSLASDANVIKSIRRYSDTSLLWFGERTFNDGSCRTGGSSRTAAYKAVVSMLDDSLKAKPVGSAPGANRSNEREVVSEDAQISSNQKPVVWLVTIVISVIFLVMIFG